MGITVSTLGLASQRPEDLIPDHQSGEFVSVRIDGYIVTSQYPNGHPNYYLVYESGFRCGLRWQGGQATPAYEEGSIPFVRGGRNAWSRQAHQSPTGCTKRMKSSSSLSENVSLEAVAT